jgi:lipopolysaccharide biosynthesis glycosyltransferase
LKENLIGAVADGVVSAVPVFCEYTQKALGIEGGKYFNSGVIVMNLKNFSKENFYQAFCDVLSSYEFRVAPDQDCLNLLCRDKVHYFHDGWNRMPQAVNVSGEPIKLIHYNLAQKPWHYDGIQYEEYFWKYAKESVFYQDILAKKAAFTPAMAARDEAGGVALLALAKAEAEREDNYYCRYLKK